MPTNNQRGNVLVILLVLCICMAGGIYWQQSRKAAAKTEAARVAAAKQAEEARASVELKALEQKIDASKSKDVLQSSLKATDDIYARWKDGKQVANLTSRIGLATPVAALQAIRRETEALIVPDCLKEGKANLLEAMRLEIEGFLSFMADVDVGKLRARANAESADKLLVLFEADRSMCPK